MTHCVLYAAKSTADVAGSIPTQLEDCRKLAEANGWTVVIEATDEGYSAFSGSRGPGLVRAKAEAARLAAEHGECHLIVQHSDRLARGDGKTATHLVEHVLWAIKANVTFASIQDSETFRNNDLLYAVVTGQRNAEDSRRKSLSVQDGKRRRAESGASTGAVAFGYEVQPKLDADGKPVMRKDKVVTERVAVPDERAAVIRVFEMAYGGHNAGAITRWLNGAQFKSKRGNTFDPSRVRDILHNRLYTGFVRHKGEWIKGEHEAFISPELFDEVQRRTKRNDPVSKSSRAGGRTRNLLSRLLFCANCGSVMYTRENAYVCKHGRLKTGVCEHPISVDRAMIEQALLNHLRQIWQGFDGWLAQQVQDRATQRDVYERAAAGLRQELAALDRDEELVNADYLGMLRDPDTKPMAAKVTASALAGLEARRTLLQGQLADTEAQAGEWSSEPSLDAELDWMQQLVTAVREMETGSRTVADMNVALCDKFDALYVVPNGAHDLTVQFIPKGAMAEMKMSASIALSQDGQAAPDKADAAWAPTGFSVGHAPQTERFTFV
jgi:DNA invertase Pin-like site-specific DNA recombinase